MRNTPHAKLSPATNSKDIDPEVYMAAISLFSMKEAEEYVLVDKTSVGTSMADLNLLSMPEDKRIKHDASLGSKDFGAFMAATTNRLESPVPDLSRFSGLLLDYGSNRDARSSLSPTSRVRTSHLFTTPLPLPEQSPTAGLRAAMKAPDASSLSDDRDACVMGVETGTVLETFDPVLSARDELANELTTLPDPEPMSTTVTKKRKRSPSTVPDSPCANRCSRKRIRLLSRE